MDALYRSDGCELFTPLQKDSIDILRTAGNHQLFKLTPVLSQPTFINIAFYTDGQASRPTFLGRIGPRGTGIKKIAATSFYVITVSDSSGNSRTYILDTDTAKLSAPMSGKFVAYSSVGKCFVMCTLQPEAFLTLYHFNGSGIQIGLKASYQMFMGTTLEKTYSVVTNWQRLEDGKTLSGDNWRYLHVEQRDMYGRFVLDNYVCDVVVDMPSEE